MLQKLVIASMIPSFMVPNHKKISILAKDFIELRHREAFNRLTELLARATANRYMQTVCNRAESPLASDEIDVCVQRIGKSFRTSRTVCDVD